MNIKDLIKGGLLTEIAIDKVSLVKSPANQRRFVFTKQADIEFTGSTDQTFDGTTITVNGEELEDLESFHFSVVNWSEEDIEEWGATPVSLSFSTKKSSTDGLDVIEPFSLHSEVKKTMEKSEILKAMNDNLGIEISEAEFDKLSVEKQKATEGLAVFSPAFNGQPVFRDAVKTLIKSETAVDDTPVVDPGTTADPDPTPEPTTGDAPLDSAGIITAIQEGFASLKKDPEKKDGDDDPDPEGDALEPVTKADLDSVMKLVKGIADAAGVKQSDETDIEKSGDGIKDEYASWKI